MKKAVVTVLKILAVLAVVALIAVFVLYDTGVYDEILKAKINRQLESSYGTSFEIFEMSDRNPIVPNFNEELKFRAYSEEKLYMSGTCDWKGKLISENYVYYYYAPAMVSEVEDIIEGSFEDYFVVQDFTGLGESVDKNPMLYDSVKDADDYMMRVYKKGTFFRVYVKEGVTDAELWDALYKLRDSGYKGHVFLVVVNDEWYEALQKWEAPCYPMHSEVERVISQRTGIPEADVDEIIRNPSPYIRGDYNPSDGFIQVNGGVKQAPK
jgi:hypothetical protein